MKDYKKILEGVVNIVNNTEKSDIGFANICAFIGENCPELKEYEDERTRRVIIEHFVGSHSCMFPYKGFTKEQIIDWLEKQGEKEPIEWNKKDKIYLNHVITAISRWKTFI